MVSSGRVQALLLPRHLGRAAEVAAAGAILDSGARAPADRAAAAAGCTTPTTIAKRSRSCTRRLQAEAPPTCASAARLLYFREWFFHNPISHLRECDGDRCEFWRFRYPKRREAAMNAVVDQALARFPPRSAAPLIVSSFGAGLLYQEFCHVAKLVQEGYRAIRLVLVDTAYTPWKQKYLARDGCCRIYCQPTQELHPDMVRPRRATRRRARPRRRSTRRRRTPSTTRSPSCSTTRPSTSSCSGSRLREPARRPAGAAVRLGRPASTSPTASTPWSPSSSQVMAHVCSAIDYKDNDKLLEEPVNHMAGNTLRSDGVCVKLVTKPGESLPGVRRGPRPPAAPANTARRCSRVALRRSVRGCEP